MMGAGGGVLVARVKELISLKDWDNMVRSGVADPMLNQPRPNGISCPKCGHELVDITPNLILLTHPAQKAIRCRKCGWSGKRLA